jgi:hypothetical protein
MIAVYPHPGTIDEIHSNDATIASTRLNPKSDDHPGTYYLLAHGPGTTTLRATRDGSTIATVDVTVKPQ